MERKRKEKENRRMGAAGVRTRAPSLTTQLPNRSTMLLIRESNETRRT